MNTNEVAESHGSGWERDPAIMWITVGVFTFLPMFIGGGLLVWFGLMRNHVSGGKTAS